MSDVEKTNAVEPVEKKTATKKSATKKTATKKAATKKTATKKAATKKTATKKTATKKAATKVKKANASKDKAKPKNATTANASKSNSKSKVKAKNTVKTERKERVEEPKDISFFFPKTKDMNKLKMIDRQVVTKPDDAEAITKIIKDYVKTPATKVITDATAGLGGTTINFANNFKSVNAVEVDKTVFEALKNNVGVYGLKNVELINKDYLTASKDLKQDVIFIDAPWTSAGGKKKHKLIRIQLGEKFLADVLNELKDKAEFYVFTAPGNFDYGFFMRNIQYPHVDVRMVPNRTWKVIVVYA